MKYSTRERFYSIRKKLWAFEQKHPRLWWWFSLLLLMLFLTTCSFLPYIGKSLVYPAVFQKQEMSGVIEGETRYDIGLATGKRRTTVFSYYFRVNGLDIRVPPSDIRKYKAGDTYEYIQYSLLGLEIGERVEYRFFWGIAGVLAIGLTGYAVYFVLFSVPMVKKKKESLEEVPLLPDYDGLSVKELYKLCQESGIRVEKDRKKDSAYLKLCLDNYDRRTKRQNWYVQRKRESQKSDWVHKGLTGLVVLEKGLLLVSYTVFMHFFIYLLM